MIPNISMLSIMLILAGEMIMDETANRCGGHAQLRLPSSMAVSGLRGC
jgi:hypothetical protein